MLLAMNEMKKLGTSVPEEVAESFDDFVERNGYLKWRAIVAAMALFQTIPAALRQNLMESTMSAREAYDRDSDVPHITDMAAAVYFDLRRFILREAVEKEPSLAQEVDAALTAAEQRASEARAGGRRLRRSAGGKEAS